MFGILASVWAVAGTLGPVLGGVFTTFASWRWCFYINRTLFSLFSGEGGCSSIYSIYSIPRRCLTLWFLVPFDGMALIALLLFLKVETPKTPILAGLATIDWLGSLTVAGGTVMLLLGLEYGGGSYPWNSAIVICLITFGVFTLGVFLLLQGTVSRYPLVPLSLFTSLNTAAPLLICFTQGLVATPIFYYLPMYFQTVLGATPLLAGVYTIPGVVTDIAGCIIQSVVIKKIGTLRPMVAIGFVLMTLGTGLYIDYPSHADWAKVIIYQGISGLGSGPLYQSIIIALQSQVRPQDLAASTASFAFIRYTGNAVGIAFGGVIFQNALRGKMGGLKGQIPDHVLDQLRESSAGAMAGVINQLPKDQQQPVRQVYTDSLKMSWVFYTVLSAVGLLGSFLLRPAQLTEQHEFTKTGLDVQRREREERLRQKREKKERKLAQANEDLEVSEPEIKSG